MAHSFLYFSILFISVWCVVSEAKPNQSCITNPSFQDSNAFANFFDKCFIDSTEVNIMGQIAVQLQAWFNEQTFPVYILVSLLVILFCVVKDSRGNDDMARYNFIRLQGLLLLMRMGLAISMTPWMWAAIQQQRPCYCAINGGAAQPVNDWWGMPSGSTFTSALLGAHLMTTVSVSLGVVFTALMGAAAVVSGQYSFGQSIVGIVLGLVLHVYSVRTPLFMRIIDFFLSLIAGFVSIAIAMRNYHNADFSFSIFFLAGLAWQVYAFTLLFVSFEWGFMKKALSQALHTLHDVDFLYFRPLNSPTGSVQSTEMDPPPFNQECYWTVFLTSVLFLVLCGLRVLAPYLDNLNVNYF